MSEHADSTRFSGRARPPSDISAPSDRLILALDVADVQTALELVRRTDNMVGIYKIGLELIYAGGLELAQRLIDNGKKVFLDSKLLDIDNTVSAATRSIAHLGVSFFTLHAYPKTILAAKTALDEFDDPPQALAVTVLTHLDDEDLRGAGYALAARELVRQRALTAANSGLSGLVCSPQEVRDIRALIGPEPIIVTPGIRPKFFSGMDDQKRLATPAKAINDGADYLVVGRPILTAKDPGAAARQILEEIETAMHQSAMTAAYVRK